jgi:hypothetical protein
VNFAYQPICHLHGSIDAVCAGAPSLPAPVGSSALRNTGLFSWGGHIHNPPGRSRGCMSHPPLLVPEKQRDTKYKSYLPGCMSIQLNQPFYDLAHPLTRHLHGSVTAVCAGALLTSLPTPVDPSAPGNGYKSYLPWCMSVQLHQTLDDLAHPLTCQLGGVSGGCWYGAAWPSRKQPAMRQQHKAQFWSVWWQPRLPVGFPCVTNNGLWPSALILVGNATLVVSERVYT